MNVVIKALRWVTDSRPAQWVVGVLIAIFALRVRDRQQKAKGREEQKDEQVREDVEAAADIQRRAAAARQLPVDPADNRGYRD